MQRWEKNIHGAHKNVAYLVEKLKFIIIFKIGHENKVIIYLR